ncbi:flagellar biosynthesis anti-sigma factor FlgM [Desulfohalovibrio reitneri]|uniref:flagellar biosynthesis anti-sigma factor FlgM n=1 Tax=Desulfohalovibrio reitneri TaxID=1307759 RepID=UPI0004A6BF1E|nr:flagellar biosynthesis anti-sigma factor FlgM [Desulfohalovibrio reitneri]
MEDWHPGQDAHAAIPRGLESEEERGERIARLKSQVQEGKYKPLLNIVADELLSEGLLNVVDELSGEGEEDD